MKKFNPSIELEKRIGNQIYEALQGEVVEEIMRKTNVSSDDNYVRSHMEGNCLKVQQDLLPDFYNICQDVKRKLNFNEPVDFYITGDAEINAYSILGENGNPHIVNLNSGLFNIMNQDELRFVVGHELGHIINRDTKLTRLINFIFPSDSDQHISLQYKIRLHDQLAELVADRYGYLATDNINACITAFYKMNSGLDLGKMEVSIDALLANNNRALDFFLHENGMSIYDHPVNPIRVQSLNIFANASSEDELNKGMDELIGILLRGGASEIDEYISRFIVSAGLFVVLKNNDNVNDDEYNKIIDTLASRQIFPREYLDEVVNSGDIVDTFTQTAEKLLDKDPSLRESLMSYMIDIVMSDKKITHDEVKTLYEIGDYLGFSEQEVAQAIARSIQTEFIPSLESIC